DIPLHLPRLSFLFSSMLLLSCYGDARVLPAFPTRRSSDLAGRDRDPRGAPRRSRQPLRGPSPRAAAVRAQVAAAGDGGGQRPGRSEEHTSELQSRENIVCRLLLEKKKDMLDTVVNFRSCTL